MAPQPSTWRGRSEQNTLDQVGCEARKVPAEGHVFFLDFCLYRTYQAVAPDGACVMIFADETTSTPLRFRRALDVRSSE